MEDCVPLDDRSEKPEERSEEFDFCSGSADDRNELPEERIEFSEERNECASPWK